MIQVTDFSINFDKKFVIKLLIYKIILFFFLLAFSLSFIFRHISQVIIQISIVPGTKMKDNIIVENFMLFQFDEKYFQVNINIYGNIPKIQFLNFGGRGQQAHSGWRGFSRFIGGQSSIICQFQFCSNFYHFYFLIFLDYFGIRRRFFYL